MPFKRQQWKQCLRCPGAGLGAMHGALQQPLVAHLCPSAAGAAFVHSLQIGQGCEDTVTSLLR